MTDNGTAKADRLSDFFFLQCHYTSGRHWHNPNTIYGTTYNILIKHDDAKKINFQSERSPVYELKYH